MGDPEDQRADGPSTRPAGETHDDMETEDPDRVRERRDEAGEGSDDDAAPSEPRPR
ncbi:hypothetical protein [Pseudonocardia sp. GCM10023141]|uniref:hypothetical protein n=1 Tax=Pseudonocardia sp. GCM10023141 TaxID=3252653 RepID=UPI00360F47EC